MTISNEGAGGVTEEVSPLYLQKEQLISEWQSQNKSKSKDGASSPDDIKVTELFSTITEMVRPGGTDKDLKTLQFIAPKDSIAKAEKCKKDEPFRLGERIVVL